MIEIEHFTFFILYLGFALLTVLSLWLFFEWKKKKGPVRPNLQELRVCEYCHFPYLSISFYKISRCPQCKSFNEKKGSH